MIVMATGLGFRGDEKREARNTRSWRNAPRFGIEVQVAGLNLQHDEARIHSSLGFETPQVYLDAWMTRLDGIEVEGFFNPGLS